METTKLAVINSVTIKAVILRRRKQSSIVTFSDDAGIAAYISVDNFIHAIDKFLTDHEVETSEFSMSIDHSNCLKLSVGGDTYIKSYSSILEIRSMILNVYSTLTNLFLPIKQPHRAMIKVAVE